MTAAAYAPVAGDAENIAAAGEGAQVTARTAEDSEAAADLALAAYGMVL